MNIAVFAYNFPQTLARRFLQPWRRLSQIARSSGPVATVRHLILWPVRQLRFFRILFAIKSSESIEDRFTTIYTHNLWGSKESVSGTGSNLPYTKNLRTQLPDLLRAHGIKTVFDGPCGDFHWMGDVVQKTAIRYVGGDIVKPLIEKLCRSGSSERISFIQIDLTQGEFPSADLMICRDCLFHLSYADCLAVLRNFLSAGIPLLLTTTHELPKGMSNHDIATGDFRLMDLFQPPYGFPADVQARIEDYLPPDPRRFMCLWSREQVSDAVESLAAYFADAGSPSPGNPGAVDPQVYRLAVKEASGEGMTRETPRQRARREAA